MKIILECLSKSPVQTRRDPIIRSCIDIIWLPSLVSQEDSKLFLVRLKFSINIEREEIDETVSLEYSRNIRVRWLEQCANIKLYE